MNKKVIVVTGASTGIGAALCKVLGKEGHSVVLASRRAEELMKVAALSGSNTLVVKADVTKLEDVERIKEEALKRFGRIDVWINNAGRGINKKVMDLNESDIDEMMNVNLKSVFWGIKTIIPYFQNNGSGHIINISSFLGRVPMVTDRSAYNAAKTAVNSITANLRVDLRRTHPGIKVSLVMPGIVITDFAKNSLYGSPLPPALMANGQTAEQVADILYGLIKEPKPEIYTNPASAEIARKYYADVAAYEENIFRG